MSTLTPAADNPCLRCGKEAGPDVPQPSSCQACPPVACADCGDPDDRACRCWISLEGMSRADLKALFAPDGFNIETDGRLTR